MIVCVSSDLVTFTPPLLLPPASPVPFLLLCPRAPPYGPVRLAKPISLHLHHCYGNASGCGGVGSLACLKKMLVCRISSWLKKLSFALTIVWLGISFDNLCIMRYEVHDIHRFIHWILMYLMEDRLVQNKNCHVLYCIYFKLFCLFNCIY